MQMPRSTQLTTAVLAFVSLAACSMQGQFARGQVVDGTGRAIAGATIELWRGGAVITWQLTDDRGFFTLSSDSTSETSTVLARAIGFMPRSVRFANSSSLTITLERAATSLPDLVLRTRRQPCDGHDDATARRLWEAARLRYSLIPLDRRYISHFRENHDDVDRLDVMFGKTDELPFVGGNDLAADTRGLANQWIADSGYAFRKTLPPTSWLLAYPQYVNWWYPRLDRWDSDHFIRPIFAKLNHFVLEQSGTGGWTLSFCSGTKLRARIVGTMSIAPDTSISSAQWHFLTGRPFEDAGGAAVFRAPIAGGSLLPVRSLFWRRLQGVRGWYYREEAATSHVSEP